MFDAGGGGGGFVLLSREVLQREIVLVVPGVGWTMFSPVAESELLVIPRLLPGKLLVSEGLLVGGTVVDLVALLLLQLVLVLGLTTQSLHSTGLEISTR